MNTFRNIIITIVMGIVVVACSTPEVVKYDTTPTVYVGIPEDMSVEGVLSKNYQPNQDIILIAEVLDNTKVIEDNIKWAKIENGMQTPISVGNTLHIKGGELKAGKHTFAVAYSDIEGLGAEFIYRVEVNAPVVRKVVDKKKSVKQWTGYVNHDNGTVTHMATGLRWMIVDDGYDRSINDAFKYAKEMSRKTGKTWSIPTIEAWSKVAHLGIGGTHMIDIPFNDLKAGAKYWSRSTPKDTTIAGKKVAYAVEITSIVGGGQNLRSRRGVVGLDSTCYTILVSSK